MSQPRFTPRPEAHAMAWSDLLPPVRRAVHDLLLRLAGAEAARDQRSAGQPPAAVGNSFLVYGARGTGKTTVLLTARQALEHSDDSGFFRVRGAAPDPLDGAARRWADQLRTSQHIVWLEPLDLEPLPPGTNLLTTLLTRVRDALERPDRQQPATTSIFEEGATDARQRLDQLISDATLMWEEVKEADTRNKANRQREAADIYASFRSRFGQAMDQLSAKLDRWHGRDAGCAIVLPIDNIDRSTDHLQAIVKLAQMVAHPCLWLVMAGDRVEVETFLERAYWKELIQSHHGTDARGKTGQTGEDETLAMARRQAGAVAQKVWPPSHRVEVDAVSAMETLDFCPPGAAYPAERLRALLGRVRVDSFVTGAAGSAELRLIDLIDLGSRLPDLGSRPAAGAGRTLSRAAAQALCLPARSVLDLWALAQRVASGGDTAPQDGPGLSRGEDAVKLVRTMLRQVTAGSAMPSALSQRLQDQILRRDTAGGTLLHFDRLALQVRHTRSLSSEISLDGLPDGTAGLTVASSLQVRCNRDLLRTLTVRDRHSPADTGMDLPELVAAWLVLLYDLLILAPDLAVIGMAPLDAPLVVCSHRLLLPAPQRALRLQLTWTAPAFSTFWAQDLFGRRWEGCAALPPPDQAQPTPEALALAWIGCALDTFDLTRPGGSAADLPARGQDPGDALDRAAALYAELQSERARPLAARRHVDGPAMQDWLETALPRLFTALDLPALAPSATASAGPALLLDWLRRHPDAALVQRWRRHQGFLIAALERRLAEAMADADAPPACGALPAETRALLQGWAWGGLRDALASVPATGRSGALPAG